MRLFKYILIIFIFISCKKDGKQINLPTSEFTNFAIEDNLNEYLIFVDQISQTEFRIIEDDTLIVKLDSTLHIEIESIRMKNRKHEYPKIVLSLDNNLPFETYNALTKEFRKVFYQSFVLNLKGEKDLRITLPPYVQNDSEYIVESLKGKGAPNYFSELEPYFKENKVLNLKVSSKELQLTDWNSNKSINLKDYAESNKKFVILLEFSPETKYQDYVNMISYLKSTFSEIIEYEKTENHLTEEEIGEKYLFIIEDKNALQHRV